MKNVIVALLPLLFAELVLAQGNSSSAHYVLVYEDDKNVEHECDTMIRQYVEWTGYGTALRSDCSVVGSYTSSYPLVYPLDEMRIELDSAVYNCRFVAYTDLGNSTYLVVECRTY